MRTPTSSTLRVARLAVRGRSPRWSLALATLLAAGTLRAQTLARDPQASAQPPPAASQPASSPPAETGVPSRCCQAFLIVRQSLGGGALTGPGQGLTGTFNYGTEIGTRLLTSNLTGVDASGYLSFAGASGGTGAVTFGLGGSIGWMPTGMFSVSYAPSVLLGLSNGNLGVGMRNALQLGTLGDVVGLELGYDFVRYDSGVQHVFRAAAWVDLGLAVHLLVTMGTGPAAPRR